MLISICGKGGVGKTTVLALLLDEVARRGYAGRVLVVDGDPAMTLAMALGLELAHFTPLAELQATLPLSARQMKGIPAPDQHLVQVLQNKGALVKGTLNTMAFHFMAMGYGQKPGCYCRLNRALTAVLNTIRPAYDLIVVDNEPGLEHISRYRLNQIDLLLLVMTQGQASWAVANRLRHLMEDISLQVGEIWEIYNRVVKTGRRPTTTKNTVFLPESDTLGVMDRQGGSPVYLVAEHPLRLALTPIVELICGPLTQESITVAGPHPSAPHQKTSLLTTESSSDVEPDDTGLEMLEREIVELLAD